MMYVVEITRHSRSSSRRPLVGTTNVPRFQGRFCFFGDCTSVGFAGESEGVPLDPDMVGIIIVDSCQR
jgi:hypothetical protein